VPKAISGTISHQSSMPIAACDWQHNSQLVFYVTLGLSGTTLKLWVISQQNHNHQEEQKPGNVAKDKSLQRCSCQLVA